MSWEIQLLKHGGVLKKCSEKVAKAKKQLETVVKSKNYPEIAKKSNEVVDAIGYFNSNLLKLKSIRKQIKANHAIIELLKMNKGDKK